MTWSIALLGVVGVTLNQVFIWPQVWRARRSVQGVAPLTALGGLLARAGVSAATYWLIAVASACWLTYGVVVGNLVISAPHMLLLPNAVVTAVLAWLSGGDPEGDRGIR